MDPDPDSHQSVMDPQHCPQPSRRHVVGFIAANSLRGKRAPCPFSNTRERLFSILCTDKKENHIFLIFKEIHSGAVAKSYMRKGFLIYEEMR